MITHAELSLLCVETSAAVKLFILKIFVVIHTHTSQEEEKTRTELKEDEN
jgi:hypothetical protein